MGLYIRIIFTLHSVPLDCSARTTKRRAESGDNNGVRFISLFRTRYVIRQTQLRQIFTGRYHHIIFAGGFLRSYSLASRIIQGAFLLVLLVITYAFTGIVTSMITTPKYQFVVRSIEEVANNEEIMPLIIEESSTHVAFEVKMF